MAELRLYAGTQFDPECVRALHEAIAGRALPGAKSGRRRRAADGRGVTRRRRAPCTLALAVRRRGARRSGRPVAAAVLVQRRHHGRRSIANRRRRRHATGAMLDAYISARLGPGLEIYARPLVQRQASGEWNRQVWLARVRYERKGAVGLRVEGGLITAPVGLANLTLRPHLNPTISQPSSLFQGLPAPEPFSPRITLLGAHLSLRRQRHRLGRQMGCPRGGDRHVAAAGAAHLRRRQPAALRQRRGGRRRHADRRPALRRVGDARRLAACRRAPAVGRTRSTPRS